MHDTVKQDREYKELFDIATEQLGYFTTEQAQSVGISRELLSHHANRGRFIRMQRGLYRYRDYPPSPHEDVMAAWLAIGKDIAVVSHDSALDLLELSNVIPDAIHLTLPRSKRYLRPPQGTAIHTTLKPIPREETIIRDGIRLTSPTRTILDSAEIGVAPEQVEMAIRQSLRRGLTTSEILRVGAEARSRRVAELVLGSIDRRTD